jgi:UDP-N-acetylmuramate dehydrogenase
MPLGAGSNTLVRDGGVEGVVIHLAKNINALSHATGELRAEAGCSDAEGCTICRKGWLSGLEFMVTIPGTIGGGLVMNAGCYGKEFKDVLIQAEGFQRDGTPFSITPAELEMRYRKTSLPEGWIFTAASFRRRNSEGEGYPEPHERNDRCQSR